MKIKTFKRPLYHLGTFDPKDKGIRGPSLEGNGLSVSECPDAWCHIAKLGGLPTWALRKPGNRFLDYHKLTAANRQTILEYGLAEGWAVLQTVWVVSLYDSELDYDTEMYCKTEKEALAEAEERVDELAGAVSARQVPVAAQPLIDWLGFSPDDMAVPDMLATLYADRVLEVDGVFWDDLLDPFALSAPRAVIAVRKLETWKITKQ